jgi:hypothetical protein
MTDAVLSAAGVLCGKKQNVAKWLKISAKMSQNGEKYPQNGVVLGLQGW